MIRYAIYCPVEAYCASQESMVVCAQNWFLAQFGGYTGVLAEGGWYGVKGRVTEPVCYLWAFGDECQLPAGKFYEFVRELAARYKQEAVACEMGTRFELVDLTTGR